MPKEPNPSGLSEPPTFLVSLYQSESLSPTPVSPVVLKSEILKHGILSRAVISNAASINFFTFWSFTLNALQKGASKVYSVEPVKHSYEQIKKLLNDFPNVEPINKAIGETNGVISMFVDSDASATNCVTTYGEMFGRESNKVDVESVNINTLIEQINSDINYMKVDCEGSEFELFKTITEKNLKGISKLVIETHGDEIDSFVHKKLTDNNFKVYKYDNILFAINKN